MPKGYWVGTSEVRDMDAIWKYRAANREVMTKYGAKFIVMHGQTIAVEGSAFLPTQTLVEFPSYQDAVDCYNSPEYKEAAKIRHAAAEGSMIIVEGYDGPQGLDL